MKTTLKNIRRSPYQALAAISITGLTVFVTAVFILVTLGSQAVLLHFETKPQVIAYLKDDHKQDQVNLLLQSLTNTGGVRKISYISKDQALETYKKSVGNDPLLLGSITDLGVITADVLPASVEITAKSPENFDALVAILEKNDIVSSTPKGVKEIDFPKDIISELSAWTKAIRTAGLILISLLVLNAIMTIIVIISMKIGNRRTEINTMKLLGAKATFILKPYLQESVIYGASGALIGWVASYITLLYTTPFLASRLSGIITLPVDFTLMILLLLCLVIGFTILGFISGWLAAVRFVKR